MWMWNTNTGTVVIYILPRSIYRAVFQEQREYFIFGGKLTDSKENLNETPNLEKKILKRN